MTNQFTDEREAMLRRIESFDYDSDRVSDDLEQDIRALVAISRAAVPDAATERVAGLEAELASRIEDRDYWYGIADKAKSQRDAANEDRKQTEAEIRDLLKVDIPSLKAERDAATTAIAEVRALHRREPGTGVDWCSHCIDNDGPWPCSTIAALDGAPEPDDDPCDEEIHSWGEKAFRPEQVDPYWIRCTLLGKHVEHEDSHTGLKWLSGLPVEGESK